MEINNDNSVLIFPNTSWRYSRFATAIFFFLVVALFGFVVSGREAWGMGNPASVGLAEENLQGGTLGEELSDERELAADFFSPGTTPPEHFYSDRIDDTGLTPPEFDYRDAKEGGHLRPGTTAARTAVSPGEGAQQGRPKRALEVLGEHGVNTPFRVGASEGFRENFTFEQDPLAFYFNQTLAWVYEIWTAGTLTFLISPAQIAYGSVARSLNFRPPTVICNDEGQFVYSSPLLLTLIETFERNRHEIRNAMKLRLSLRNARMSEPDEFRPEPELTWLDLIREYNTTLPSAVGMFVRGAFSLEGRRVILSKKFLNRAFTELETVPACSPELAQRALSHLRLEVARERGVVLGRYNEVVRERRRSMMRNFYSLEEQARYEEALREAEQEEDLRRPLELSGEELSFREAIARKRGL